MSTKIFCDRCENEITSRTGASRLRVSEVIDSHGGSTTDVNSVYFDLCADCKTIVRSAPHIDRDIAHALKAAREWVELGPELPGISPKDDVEVRGLLATIDEALARAGVTS